MVQAPPSPTTSEPQPGLTLSFAPRTHLTPAIGTAFDTSLQLSALLTDDAALATLARLIAERGVVFFPAQSLTLPEQKELGLKLGALTGRPEGSGLHKHPISEDAPELGAETSVISSENGIARAREVQATMRASRGWHSDITFESVPADFSILKMHTLPPVGGDTLWASAYEAYDRLSPAFKVFLAGLHAEHDGNFFHNEAKRLNRHIQQNRGHLKNSGEDLRTIHPVIRTHPVTGHRALFVNKTFTTRIVELGTDESSAVLDYLFRHIAENHDLQVRYRWAVNDVAIWDNRCTFHTATNDYTERRVGNRVVGIGEVPYLDPKSVGRREALAAS